MVRKQEQCTSEPNQTIRDAVSDPHERSRLRARLRRSWFPIDDVFQETVRRGLTAERDGRYDPSQGSPLAFLTGIARRVELEWRRKQRRHDPLAAEPEGREEPALDRLIEAEMLSQVASDLARLTACDRALLMRRYWEVRTRGQGPFTGTERGRLRYIIGDFRRRWLIN